MPVLSVVQASQADQAEEAKQARLDHPVNPRFQFARTQPQHRAGHAHLVSLDHLELLVWKAIQADLAPMATLENLELQAARAHLVHLARPVIPEIQDPRANPVQLHKYRLALHQWPDPLERMALLAQLALLVVLATMVLQVTPDPRDHQALLEAPELMEDPETKDPLAMMDQKANLVSVPNTAVWTDLFSSMEPERKHKPAQDHPTCRPPQNPRSSVRLAVTQRNNLASKA